MTRALVPLFVDVADKDVLVVGGGAVAARKIEELALAGARVRVVAKDVIQAVVKNAAISLENRPFAASDVDNAWLVVAATDDPETQRAIADACEGARIFVVAVDDPANASAYNGAVLRRGPLTVAISTSGEAPALARLLREVLEQALPDDDWVDAARALREKWKRDATPMGSRFAELVRVFKDRA